MKASLIMIGTEITRGIIQDSHGVLLSRELTHLGVHVAEIVSLPDDGTIGPVLSALMRSSDLIIITGGLGPTTDDMTRSVIAGCAGVPLTKDAGCWDFLLGRLGDRAYGANEKQAYIPEGFTMIPNHNGTAPGFYGYGGSTLLISLPGPPREMHPMLYDSVLPLLRDKLDLPQAERDEYTSFITAEAKLEELYEDADSSLDWGTRFQDYRISLYVSGKTRAERDSAIAKLREKLGKYRLVEGDADALTMAIDALRRSGSTVSVAESCTGGLLSMLLTERAGASEYMLGSVTSYAASVKADVLGVPESVIREKGTVSPECAIAMADGVRRLTGSDYSVSVTGVAGPDEDEGKSVGTVHLGFSSARRESVAISVHFSSWGRASIRRKSVVTALLLLSAYISGEDIARIASTWKDI